MGDGQEQDQREGGCQVWGVLNLTSDSFSDGGQFLESDAAWARAQVMIGQGASVIDLGAESSRPAGKTYGAGASHVSASDELKRLLPLVRRLKAEPSVCVSVDTVKGDVAEACLAAGADIINDVSMGRSLHLLQAVAAADAQLVLMHTRARGEANSANTDYADVVDDVLEELQEAVRKATSAGIRPQQIWIDPGIGFAKTPSQNATLLARMDAFVDTGHRVLLGASRKSFIAALASSPEAGPAAPGERLGGSLAAIVMGALAGVQAVRVHDVFESWQALEIVRASRSHASRSHAGRQQSGRQQSGRQQSGRQQSGRQQSGRQQSGPGPVR